MQIRKILNSAKRVIKTCKKGDSVECFVNGKLVGTYEFLYDFGAEYQEPDCKTPFDWVRGIHCFEIASKGLENPVVEFKKRDKKKYIKLIAKWMKEKGRDVVYFEKNTYEDWKRDMPHFLDTDTGNCFYITELRTDGNELNLVVVLKRGKTPYCGAICGTEENLVSPTDGTIETLLYEIFNEVYHAINDADDDDIDDWERKNED